MSSASPRPIAVVVGFIGKLPYAGMSLYILHYIAGLQDLGYDVHYVERLNKPTECYDPAARVMTDDPAFALDYLRGLLPRFGIAKVGWSFIDRSNHCHGAGWTALRTVIGQADFVITLADATWFDELDLCPRRAFLDGDPMFTQANLLQPDSQVSRALAHYETLFTYCTRMGQPDCTVPPVGRQWIPSRPAVATAQWDVTPGSVSLPVTSLMHWASGNDVTYNGHSYGHKDREFQRFLDFPKRASADLVLALGGRRAPREEICRHGWRLVDPLEVTGTIESYRAFIAQSRADFGIAKHAYVASRCGWFSDRSTCFLASGRPVLHQDTGCGDWLPTGSGVLLFSDMDSAFEGLREIEGDYQRHARAARVLAEEYFEAATVVGRMLEDAGFR